MTTKKLSVTAMGIALFVVLALCLQVPVFENYYLCLGYVSMMVFCYYFGIGPGIAVGTVGVVLYCVLINGLRGMPGWAAGNLIIGLGVGLACRLTKDLKRQWLRQVILIAAIAVSTAAGILGVKSFVEFLLYAQPMAVRIAKNIYAFIADVVVLTVSLPVCLSLKGIVKKLFPGEIMI